MQTSETEMDIFQAILARRSVRSYTRQRVTHKAIMALLTGAARAPAVLHEEPCAFVIIQDRELLQNLSDHIRPLLSSLPETYDEVNIEAWHHPDFNLFFDAGTLIIICTRSTASFAEANCWLAAENLILAACGMNLGTCIIGAALPAMKTLELKPRFGIPDQFEAVVPIVLGWPRGETRRVPRKAPVIVNMIPSLLD
ncbi:MAG: nitroreductase [Betaproteobacteria bacterium HGW-Betaproteobacteria-1]|jgi:nitroreductase|nr:MAG: nitroreductase [Betaproteobacteria bacterium HGW-Betaproteobacteria-1]